MDTETQPQEHDFGVPQWAEIGGGYGPSQHRSPINEFNGFTYGSSPVMPVEPSYSMSIPQPYTSQQLLPLSTPSQWPSMLTTQSTFPPVPLPPMPISSMPNLHPIHTAPIATAAPTPRRTLTDNDRRRMCMYHEENPHVKQTEIGAMFGVERSTVSKVLRQKEKYLYPDDGSRSPIKKSKGKFPDIERALSNWVRNHQRQGGQLNDEMIKEKAIFFASTVGGPENHQKILNSNWLEKFKQKNYLRSSQSRKGSIDAVNELDSPGNGQSNASLSSQTLSPLSPTGTTTPSPLSPKQKSSIKESLDGALPGYSSEFRQLSHSQSANSADRKLSLPTSTTSPTPIVFSENPFSPGNQSRVQQDSGSNSSRPRSQTFPIAVTEPVANGSSDHVSPKNVFQPSTSPDVADEDHGNARPSSNESIIKRNRSNPEIKTNSMQPPPPPQPTTASPISSPGSPTHDEARRALELVVTYFNSQPTGLGAQDYVAIGKLMQKLELPQNQAAGLSGLHRIDENADGHRVSKKRSIHTL
ncbi:conserved hypothetical protein [Histoplasma capsulatum var. duboisii H88]|uniref:Conserved Tc5 transposase DNA-binding domain, CENPB domain n=1 Tax=Ajellomyces capsulatus (strain H88) TaxID=544711 RepID=F0U9A0_AJEC8|nr:conserved hypothetical protein [Histoplasma capsulatum var. duboisii H88]QSS52517.1 conserved Tc5 transposase DNA-binding domain, CENPB domain [Histoplasma capsulatum var. duboisii H88]